MNQWPDILFPKQVRMGDGIVMTVPGSVMMLSPRQPRALVVIDADIHQLGLADDVLPELTQQGIATTIFSDVRGEPKEPIAEALIQVTREAQPTTIIGFGGGSALDLAKLAAVFAVNEGKVRDFFGAHHYAKPRLPLILIPTTAGTGAEATRIAMVTIEGKKAILSSPAFVPDLAVIDPLLTVSLPPRLTAATGIDALSHALEASMSKLANSFTDLAADAAIQGIAKHLQHAFADGTNIEARRGMAFAAFQAGLSLNAGVVLGHSIAYTIGNMAHLPHGVTCAMALPYCIAYNAHVSGERLKRLAANLPYLEDPTVRGLISWVANLNQQLGIPASLQEVGIMAGELDSLVSQCTQKYPRPTNPAPVESSELRRLYDFMYRGDVLGYLEHRLSQS